MTNTGNVSVSGQQFLAASGANRPLVAGTYYVGILAGAAQPAAGVLKTASYTLRSRGIGNGGYSIPITPIALNGGTIDTNGFNVLFSGAFSGAGGLTKIGLGSAILSSVNTINGSVAVNGGTLNVAGTLSSLDVQVNSGGTLLFELGGMTTNSAVIVMNEISTNGNLNGLIGSGTVTSWESSYSLVTSQHNQIGVGGTAPAISGNLTLGALLNSYNPAYGDVFDLLDWVGLGPISGSPTPLSQVVQVSGSVNTIFTVTSDSAWLTTDRKSVV